MALIDRVRQAFSIGSDAVATARVPSDMNSVADALDKIIDTGVIDINPVVEKEFQTPQNKLNVYRTSSNLYTFHSNILRSAIDRVNEKSNLYAPGAPENDFILAEFWKYEPILAGAVYSMSAKMSTLSWTVLGTKRMASQYADILDNALSMNGAGWGDFISPTAQDFYTTNRGSFWQTPRDGSHLTGRLAELAYMDSLCCAMTGNMHKPVFYSSAVTGQDLFLRPGEFAHFASMVSPREEMYGSGFCAVNRAFKSARILIGLSDYDWEKLNNLPPEGVAAVSGLTKDEFLDSLEIWKMARASNKSLTYPQVLWLLGSQPNTAISVDFTGFSQMPESFEREKVIPQYVNMLALVFGVDAREFWPISSSSLGTAAESEIQHMKAKGKGPGEFIAAIERYFNREMPEGVEFGFDTQDVSEDQIAASIAKGWIDAFMPLYNPGGKGTPPSKTAIAPGLHAPEGGASQSNLKQPEGGASDVEPLLTKEQFLRLLIDRRVLPGWLVDDNKVIRTDLGLMQKQYAEGDPETPVIITWKEGKLSLARQPAYELGVDWANTGTTDETVVQQPFAQEIKENGSEAEFEPMEAVQAPNIQGKPIPVKESLRGPRVTKNTLQTELELWAVTPELQAYAPTPDETDYWTAVINSTEA